MKWTEKYRVSTHDTDINQRLSLTGILRYLQETAFYHMENTKPSYQELFSEGKAFLINRMTLSVYREIYSHDEIEVETWASESAGLAFNRCYRLRRRGEIAAEAIAVWSLYNFRDKRFIRVSDFENGYGEEPMLELDMPKRFHIPRETELSLVGEHTVRYIDADLNRHMNNTVYGDFFCGFLPDMTGKHVIKFDINYRNEAPLGESVKVYLKDAGEGTDLLRSVCGGKTNAEAMIMVENIEAQNKLH